MAVEHKAAFIRHDGLWMKIGANEYQLVREKGLHQPSWSYDGSMISYRDSGEKLWVYNTLTKNAQHVYHSSVTLPKWSPTENTIAFQANHTLNIRNMDKKTTPFQYVSGGADQYAWIPDGTGFVVSSDADLTPIGWTQVKLYNVPKKPQTKARLLHTLPPESDTFFAIGTTSFFFSKSERWLAFIACPTASYSADTNFLSVFSLNEDKLKVAGKMLAKPDWMKWHPAANKLAFIEGEGRLSSENKKLAIYQTDNNEKRKLTPLGLADGDFTWNSDTTIVVSRAKESGWNEEPNNRYLVQVNVMTNTQTELTSSDSSFSAHSPVTLSDGTLAYERSSSNSHDIILNESNGPYVWITNITASQWAIFGMR
ncbi:TolB family protein [Fictibacillus iocasae]|uniref:TolB family protein n=1 Tax=Fictibacillus iocasae TaxID=2715437 RepID=A0ABW2NR53_9BACL